MLLAALLLSAIGCGEIDLPQTEENAPPIEAPSGESTTEGDDTTTEGDDTTAEGDDTTTEGDDSTTEGDDTTLGDSNISLDDDDTTTSDDTTTTDDEQTPEGTEQEGESMDIAVGCAVLTHDRHLLIDDRFYLSVIEMRQIASAFSATKPTEAIEMAQHYVEGNLDSGWRIPTEEEARSLRDIYASESGIYGNDPLALLNKLLTQHDLTVLSLSDRLLCDEGRKTFNFAINGSVLKAGAKTTYRLRLVHDK